MSVADPIALLMEIHQTLKDKQIKFATYGGLALAAFGTPRFTQDADLALTSRDVPEVMALLKEKYTLSVVGLDQQPFGELLVTRLTVFDEGPKGNTIDLVTPKDEDYSRRAMTRNLKGRIRDQQVHLISLEDFVLFKLMSSREQDLIDAVTVLKKAADLFDRDLLEHEIRQLTHEKEAHFLTQRWKRLQAMISPDNSD